VGVTVIEGLGGQSLSEEVGGEDLAGFRALVMKQMERPGR